MNQAEIQAFLVEIEKLHERHELSKTVSKDYFEPGMMEYLDQSEGIYEEETGEFRIRFEAKGVRYEGRTEQIEKVKLNDPVQIQRDQKNIYNPNNFRILTKKERDIGNCPADLCNAMAPFYDGGSMQLISAKVSYVEPLSVRSRHAKQAILFVEVVGKIL